MLYGYCRVSTDLQESSSDAQVAALNAYAVKTGQLLPEENLFVDEDVSGSIPLRDRKEGKRMWDRLGRGDTVVIATKDRAFRSLVDAALTVMQWRELGIKLHILDFPVDLSTDEGEMVFLQGAVFSQYERKQIGKRIRVGLAHRKACGLPYGGMRPWGYIKQAGKWVPCPKERELGERALKMRKAGLTMQAIAVACVHHRKPVVKKKASGYYHVSDLSSLIRAAEAGYPVRTQAMWLKRVPAPTQPAAKSGDPQLSS
jgi:DNA invertase Pin-like site-specific DNA recombinase